MIYFDGFGPEPPLPWTDEASAELHDDAEEIFKARLVIPHLKELHELHVYEKVLRDRETDFTDAMVRHGKYSHAWPDGLTVKIYAPKRKGRHQTSPPESRIYYAEKSAT
jgi:hypothetical protein